MFRTFCMKMAATLLWAYSCAHKETKIFENVFLRKQF